MAKDEPKSREIGLLVTIEVGPYTHKDIDILKTPLKRTQTPSDNPTLIPVEKPSQMGRKPPNTPIYRAIRPLSHPPRAKNTL